MICCYPAIRFYVYILLNRIESVNIPQSKTHDKYNLLYMSRQGNEPGGSFLYAKLTEYQKKSLQKAVLSGKSL